MPTSGLDPHHNPPNRGPHVGCATARHSGERQTNRCVGGALGAGAESMKSVWYTEQVLESRAMAHIAVYRGLESFAALYRLRRPVLG